MCGSSAWVAVGVREVGQVGLGLLYVQVWRRPGTDDHWWYGAFAGVLEDAFDRAQLGDGDAGEIVDLGSEAGVIEKSGAYYSWKGDRIAQGRENA